MRSTSVLLLLVLTLLWFEGHESRQSNDSAHFQQKVPIVQHQESSLESPPKSGLAKTLDKIFVDTQLP
jgi:hypothetical protein